ncbi:hypothetical protein [Niabella ginsenosidivorans]|uniref:hypothetical protein n=1 Tax=Niabella ginsenosidivorans TaxID=1176587 RepID=UPI0014720825|nr:hypothetical protein [Niabella ginsenosidivorans]
MKNKKNKVKPDPETLHKTDPQDEMKGPVSTPMQKLEKAFEPENKTKKKKPGK